MIKKLIIFLAVTSFLLILTGCLFKSTQSRISGDLNINARNSKVALKSDNHGGFHGDGTTFTKLTFSGDDCLISIKNNPDWNTLPLPSTLNLLLSQTSELFDDSVFMPQIQQGYYCFIDRHPNSIDSKNHESVLNRVSINITLGIYDTDTNSLYYIKIDT